MTLNELIQVDLDRLVHIEIRGGENLLEGKHLEIGQRDIAAVAYQMYRLDRVCPDLDAPTVVLPGHDMLLSESQTRDFVLSVP